MPELAFCIKMKIPLSEKFEGSDWPDWPTSIGATIVLVLMALLILTAVGGWSWVKQFMEAGAPAWVQAFGSIAAIIAALRIVQRQHDMEVSRLKQSEQQENLRRVRSIKALFFSAAITCERVARNVGKEHVVWRIQSTTISEVRNRLLSLDPLLVPDAALLRIIEISASSLYLASELISELQTPRPEIIHKAIHEVVMKSARECWLGLYEATDLEIKLQTGTPIDLNREMFSDFKASLQELDEIRSNHMQARETASGSIKRP